MFISVTLPSVLAVTAAYANPPRENASTLWAPPSPVNPPSIGPGNNAVGTKSWATPTATMLTGSVTSIIWTPFSRPLVTNACMASSIEITATFSAALSTVKPSLPSKAASSGNGRLGFVTSIICTPSAPRDATMAYVLSPMLKTSTPVGLDSASKVGSPEPASCWP